MKGLIAWFAINPVAANLLMVAILVTGGMTMSTLRQEVVPLIDVEAASVTVVYPGAAPTDVESGICMPIEEAVQGIGGVDQVKSTAREGVGVVMVEFLSGENRQEMLDDIKSAIDRIDNFPVDAEEPQVALVEVNEKVMSIAIWGETDAITLRAAAETVEDALIAAPGISLVSINNAPPFEISIEVSEDSLRRYGLSFDEVAAAVRRASLDLPGGGIRTDGGEILLRTNGQAYRGAEFSELLLRSHSDGRRVVLGDVAQILDGLADTDQSTRFNGKLAVTLDVFRIGDQDALDMAERVRAALDEAAIKLPAGIHLDITGDDTKMLRDRLDLMLRNGRAGLVLVLISLALFLRLRLALWVTLGIPLSFFGALILLPGLGVSINLISLFAFIIVLGIVVDDAIVVAENVHEHRQRGKSGLQAAIEGTHEVAIPVTFAILTTIAAFLPMLYLPGNMGQFSRNIPLIVIAVLVFSLIEVFLILPAHLRHLPTDAQSTSRGPWARLQGTVNRGMDGFLQRVFRPSLAIALRWRYLVLTIGVAAFMLAIGWVGSGRTKFNFFPVIESDFVAVQLSMPLGTPVESTEAAIRRFEESARTMQGELTADDDSPAILSVSTSVGTQPFRNKQQNSVGTATMADVGGHLAEVTLELASAEIRSLSAKTIAAMWRDRTGSIAGAEEVTLTADLLGSDGDINVRLSGPHLDELQFAAAALRDRLERIAGVTAVRDTYRSGKRELQLELTPEGEALGFTLADLGRQVRQGFHGEKVQTVQRGRDEVEVYVRYPRDERRKLATLEELRLRAPDGREVPFSLAARTTEGRGYSMIERLDRRRSISVLADVNKETTTPDTVISAVSDFLAALPEQHAGLSYGFEGRQREQQEFMGTLLRINMIALLAIFVLLAIPLRSYLQPLIIMTAIPFGMIGAVVGHVALDLDLTIFSLIGVVALSGIVINDSLVLIDLVNRRVAAGEDLHDAVREAGVRRFRPILLTTITTFLGLTPLLLERSMQAKFLIPMAVSVAFGVAFATAITLMLVPALLVILEDIRNFFGRFRGGRKAPSVVVD